MTEQKEPSDFDDGILEHYAMLRIASQGGLDLAAISDQLNVAPTRTQRRGNKPSPRGRPSTTDVWIYQAPVPPEAALSEHVDALAEVALPHSEFLRNLKSSADITIHLGYLSNSEIGGLEIPHASLAIFSELEIDLKLHITLIQDE